MPSPFEMAWMLLKNEGEMPFQNNYDEDPHELPEPSSSFRKLPSTSFKDYTPGATPPSLTPKEVADDMRQRQATKEQERFSDMQSTPVPPLLQGRQPSNIVHSSGRLPISSEDVERMMQEGQRGQMPLGQGVPAPLERMITDYNLQQSMKAGGMPPTNAAGQQ